MFLQCLSAPTEFLGLSLLLINHLLGPRLYLAKDSFILGTLSWAIMTKSHIFIHQHSLLWRRLLLLRQILVLGLGHRPNIWVDNEFLSPSALQYQIKHWPPLLLAPASYSLFLNWERNWRIIFLLQCRYKLKFKKFLLKIFFSQYSRPSLLSKD